jgi:hypothetical protein
MLKRNRFRSPSRLVFESLLIILSVALGFAVAQWREHSQDRQLAASALRSLYREVEHNLAMVERQLEFHGRWVAALATYPAEPNDARGEAATAWDVFLATWPGFDNTALANFTEPFPAPRHAAWEAALSSGALRHVDYDITARLADIYQLQRSLQTSIDQLPFTSAHVFDPGSRMTSVRQLARPAAATTFSKRSAG